MSLVGSFPGRRPNAFLLKFLRSCTVRLGAFRSRNRSTGADFSFFWKTGQSKNQPLLRTMWVTTDAKCPSAWLWLRLDVPCTFGPAWPNEEGSLAIRSSPEGSPGGNLSSL